LQQRCIIPSSGFIEWQHKAVPGKKTAYKIPYFIQPAKDTFFYMAGLYSIAPLPSGMLHSFTIVTTEANSTMANIHNTKKRMPTILSATDAATWLQTENISVIQDLAHLQAPDATLKPHIIAKNFKEISNPLAPFYDTKPTQLDLFG
jgi:putative SOS response-associated peptidase YedK